MQVLSLGSLSVLGQRGFIAKHQCMELHGTRISLSVERITTMGTRGLLCDRFTF